MNSIPADSQKHETKKSWKWWQSNANTPPLTPTSKSPEIVICAKDKEKDNYNDDGDDDDQAGNNKLDCSSSIAQSSLMVHYSIHSKESEDIASTTSIKSKPWVSKKLKQPTRTAATNSSKSDNDDDVDNEEEEDEGKQKEQDDQNTLEIGQSINKIETNSTKVKTSDKTTPSSSLMNTAPSASSSTVPVYNFNINDVQQPPPLSPHRKSLETTALFSGIKVSYAAIYSITPFNKVYRPNLENGSIEAMAAAKRINQ